MPGVRRLYGRAAVSRVPAWRGITQLPFNERFFHARSRQNPGEVSVEEWNRTYTSLTYSRVTETQIVDVTPSFPVPVAAASAVGGLRSWCICSEVEAVSWGLVNGLNTVWWAAAEKFGSGCVGPSKPEISDYESRRLYPPRAVLPAFTLSNPRTEPALTNPATQMNTTCIPPRLRTPTYTNFSEQEPARRRLRTPHNARGCTRLGDAHIRAIRAPGIGDRETVPESRDGTRPPALKCRRRSSINGMETYGNPHGGTEGKAKKNELTRCSRLQNPDSSGPSICPMLSSSPVAASELNAHAENDDLVGRMDDGTVLPYLGRTQSPSTDTEIGRMFSAAGTDSIWDLASLLSLTREYSWNKPV
ncbi:hypothetical protein DFP72DRAFT_1140708 [Ephemerocybe angulata]|uniref:Uncharacterized protein n=1 Tax=Ephemerocybe angulata TaxID=980116 RepID=A0A8H6MET9_9AGAR|nr:hypothetical protein DFP72DRAFT_1140708 [Tulosesus angulatus]